MSKKIASQEHAAQVGGSLLKLDPEGDFQTAIEDDFVAPKVAVFIHGFTADATYMRPLMEQFTKRGFATFAFNYPCYDGIDRAAGRLLYLFALIDEALGGHLLNNRVVVVGHSMGGLVARALVGPEGGHMYVRKVFTLGSPHAGTMLDSRMLEWYVTWGETISGLVYGGYSKSKRSALQLMRADHPDLYLQSLQNTQIPEGSVEFHSISAGKNYLTLGPGKRLRERVANFLIQKHLKDPANDGLVLETSSNLSGAQYHACASGCQHHNDYKDFGMLNHSNLCGNQALSMKIAILAK